MDIRVHGHSQDTLSRAGQTDEPYNGKPETQGSEGSGHRTKTGRRVRRGQNVLYGFQEFKNSHPWLPNVALSFLGPAEREI